MGSGKAKELYYFSERLSAEDAQRLGIVNAIFPPADFEREVMERAHRLARGPSSAFRYMKENLNRAVSGELGDCMDLEVTHHVHTGLTEDHREAAQAFMDKREPRFRGRSSAVLAGIDPPHRHDSPRGGAGGYRRRWARMLCKALTIGAVRGRLKVLVASRGSDYDLAANRNLFRVVLVRCGLPVHLVGADG